MTTNFPDASKPEAMAGAGPKADRTGRRTVASSDAGPNQARGGGGVAPQWKQLYQAAILEMETENIMRRIVDAERAIVERALALHSESSESHAEELGALAYSANFLAELRRLENSRAAGAKSCGAW
jgi:hypothetical protein